MTPTKTRRTTILLGLLLALVAGFILVGSLVIGPRATHIEAQNKEALAYIDAVTRLIPTNGSVSNFHMELIRAGLDGGSIDVRATLASTNNEADIIKLLRSERSPYAVGGAVGFGDSTNLHRISIRPEDR